MVALGHQLIQTLFFPQSTCPREGRDIGAW
jgi:hypothetical protein